MFSLNRLDDTTQPVAPALVSSLVVLLMQTAKSPADPAVKAVTAIEPVTERVRQGELVPTPKFPSAFILKMEVVA